MLDKKRILDLSYWFASLGIVFALGCLCGPDIRVMLALFLLLFTFACLKLCLHHRLDKKRILDLSYWFASCGMAFALGCLCGPNIPFMLAFLLLLTFSFLKLCLHHRIEKFQNIKAEKEGSTKEKT
jgi:4-amino-4-deoxy-L-arabinose transferase-like glycosyltransferase